MFVHILVTQDGQRCHAHALDFDLMTVGDTYGEALDHLLDQIEIYVEDCVEQGISSFDEMKREAPREYYDRFEEAFKNPDTPFSVVQIPFQDRFKGIEEQAAALV